MKARFKGYSGYRPPVPPLTDAGATWQDIFRPPSEDYRGPITLYIYLTKLPVIREETGEVIMPDTPGLTWVDQNGNEYGPGEVTNLYPDDEPLELYPVPDTGIEIVNPDGTPYIRPDPDDPDRPGTTPPTRFDPADYPNLPPRDGGPIDPDDPDDIPDEDNPNVAYIAPAPDNPGDALNVFVGDSFGQGLTVGYAPYRYSVLVKWSATTFDETHWTPQGQTTVEFAEWHDINGNEQSQGASTGSGYMFGFPLGYGPVRVKASFRPWSQAEYVNSWKQNFIHYRGREPTEEELEEPMSFILPELVRVMIIDEHYYG